MNDSEIVGHIDSLVEEEHRLERSHGSEEGLSPEEARRLQAVEAELDQLWDLLRQRRARRSAGQDPDRAEARPVDTVEHFQQ